MHEKTNFLQEWCQDILSYIKGSLDFIIANEQLGREYSQSINDIIGDDNYIVFKIISNLYYRENFHSDIIAFLLNPKESHHCGDIFLISFLFLLNKLGKNVIFSNYLDAEVIREEGKIDILIKSRASKRAIVIENKINNAQDMPRQMPRYYDYSMSVTWYLTHFISYYTKAHKTVEWAGVDTRYGYNGDNTLTYHHSILQWSRRDKRAVHAHVSV